MIIIAFGHRKRVGKDTCARFLCSYLRIHKKGSNIQYHGFADKIKDVAFQLYSWAGLQPGYYYDEPEHEHEREVVLEKIGQTPRQIWINIGQRIRHSIYDDTWIEYLIHNVRCDICIIKDLRFPAECKRIHATGGFVYKVENPKAQHVPDEADDPLEGYEGWDNIIQNNGTLAELNTKIVNLGEKLMSMSWKNIT